MILGQETRWAYSTTLPSPRGTRVTDGIPVITELNYSNYRDKL